jgi:hypothetical protein
MERNHYLGLNFLKGVVRDIHNALLAGIVYNLKLRFNQIKEEITLWLQLILTLVRLNQSNYYSFNLNASFLNTNWNQLIEKREFFKGWLIKIKSKSADSIRTLNSLNFSICYVFLIKMENLLKINWVYYWKSYWEA